MTKKQRFLYNGMLLTAVGFAIKGAVLFLGAFISGKIGAEGMGLQALIGTVYAFAVTFATSGISLSVTRLVAASVGEGQGGDRILRAAFLYATCFGVGGTALLFLLADCISMTLLSDERIIDALKILSLSLLPIAYSSVISGYFVAVRRVTLNAVVQVSGQILRIGLTVLLLSRFSDGLASAMRALALSCTLTEVLCFCLALVEYTVDRRMYGSVKNRGYAIGEVCGMALPLAFSAYVRSFLMSVEHSLIPRRLVDRGNTRTEALSSYGYLSGMALPIVLFPMTPLSSFSGLLVPEFAECESTDNTARMERIAARVCALTLVYAIAVAVFIFAFSEELGYVLYGTYAAGRYVAVLAPVIPLMYLDHVTDSMLKGIGEHVFSMWINIADSLLSVILVWLLIPIFDVFGYALVIIIMELFNFTLSFMRLRYRVHFRIRPLTSILIPLGISFSAVYLTKSLFAFSGSTVGAVWLILEMIFALSVFLSLTMIVDKMTHITAK